MQENRVQPLGQKDSLEKEMATHSSILAWKNPMDRGARQATVHGVAWVRYNLGIRPPPYRKDHDTGVIGSFYMTKCTHLFGIHISNEINL